MAFVFAWTLCGLTAALGVGGCSAVQEFAGNFLDGGKVDESQQAEVESVSMDGWGEVSDVPQDLLDMERPLLIEIHSLDDAEEIIRGIGDTEAITTVGTFWITDDMRGRIQDVIDLYAANGRDSAFLLLDVETGAGLAYNIDESMFCASGIKAAYICALAYYHPEAFSSYYGQMKKTLTESSNDDYEFLFNTYEEWIPNKWRALGGMGNQQYGRMYTYYPVRDWAQIWMVNWEFLSQDTAAAETIKEWLSYTYRSAFAQELRPKYETFSKAGWNPAEYASCNEGGIVVTPNGTYLLIIMTDKGGYPNETITAMVNVLADAYDEYAPHKALDYWS